MEIMKISKFYFMKENNEHVSLESLNQKYIEEFLKAFGGGTLYNATGLWVNPNGEIVKDSDLICELFFDETDFLNKNGMCVFDYLRKKALSYKRDAKQDSVSIVVDGNAFIID